MNTKLTIKNFRVFDENGVSIELNPISILTGSNSSGKSTIVKALLLLQDFCQQLKADFEEGRQLRLENYKMDFHKQPNSILGSFDLARHRKSSSNTEERDINDNITIEVEVKSFWLLQNVILHLEFGTIERDELNNGYLQAYSIKTLDEIIIYQADRGGDASMDFSSVKRNFLHFLYGQHAFAKWQEEMNRCQALSADPDEKIAQGFDGSNDNISENIGIEAVFDVLNWQVSHCEQTWKSEYHSSANSLIRDEKEIEPSFIRNSPNLNVFCYFPCLEILKDTPKDNIKSIINQAIESNDFEKGKMYNYTYLMGMDNYSNATAQEIINEFFDLFEKSGSGTLHEFISKVEDELFFIDPDIPLFGGKQNRFAFPFCNPAWHCKSDYLKHWGLIIMGMDLINKAMTKTNKEYFRYDMVNDKVYYFMETGVRNYCRQIIEEIFVQILPNDISYIPTTILTQQRMYSLEDNSVFSNKLKLYFEVTRRFATAYSRMDFVSRQRYEEYLHYEPNSFINKWIKALDVAHHVKIETHAEGYGVTISLFESEDDINGMPLADKGIGILQLFIILLNIEIAILESITNVLRNPIKTDGLNEKAIEYLSSYSELHPITVALEEPESHLHPKYQSLLADMIVEAYTQYNVHFLIETHSEYLIRKLQLLVARSAKNEDGDKDNSPFQIFNNDKVSIYYIYSRLEARDADTPQVKAISICSDGYLNDTFGPGFFDEATSLSRQLM